MTTKKFQYLGLAALALLLPASSAMAVAYVAQGPGGDLLTNAYQTVYSSSQPGPFALTEIDGVFSTPSATSVAAIPDLFAINITGLAPFSATTVSTPGTSVYDTQLFLFNSAGLGIYFNDDDPSQIIAPGVQFGAGATLPNDYLPAGEYYLGIATEGNAPQSASGNIFPYPVTDGSSLTAVDGPTGPGGAGPLTKWSTTSDDVETGSFQIFLTGAAPLTIVPEPSSFALLGVGGLLLAATLRRKRASVQV